MKRLKKTKIFILIILLLMSSILFVSAETIETEEELPQFLPEDHELFTFDEEGNKIDLEKSGPALLDEVVPDFSDYEFKNMGGARTFKNEEVYLILNYSDNNKVVSKFNNFYEADSYVQENSNHEKNLGVFSGGTTRSIKHGVVNFKTKNWQTNTHYKEEGTNTAGYTNGNYGADGALIEVSKDGKQVKFKMAGVTGWVAKNDVQLIDYADAKSVSFYTVTKGRLLHKVPNDLTVAQYPSGNDVGSAPSYLEEGGVYYSYDGHYFYTKYKTMIDDYKLGTYKNSVNPQTPYYNYYQFLPHRSLTSTTAAQLDEYAKTFPSNSKMRGMGKVFKSSEYDYGTNALLMYGVAMNESARGTSHIAQTKNNLFGHNAYDSNPNWANGYPNAGIGIEQHAKVFLSNGYLDAKDWRYFGPHLGDKASGINVKYASDPYWGEKAASFINRMERDGYIPAERELLGIKKDHTNLRLRKYSNTSSSSNILYNTGTASHFPFVIHEEIKGENIEGNSTWYKVLSDSTLDASRSKLVQYAYNYDGAKMFGYASAKYVDKIDFGGKRPPKPKPKTKPNDVCVAYDPIIKGDVNGDCDITSMDYAMIKNYILGKIKLNDKQKKAADFNGKDGITSMDYALVKNEILKGKK